MAAMPVPPSIDLAAGKSTWRGRLVAALVLGLAAVLRLWALGRDGMWSDECLTATWAQLPWRETLAAPAADNNAPLYFLLAKLSPALFGSNELTWRLLPALLGVAGVAAVWWVGRRLLSSGAGLAAAFLLAISPLHVHYSREARNYTLLLLLVLLSFAAAARVRQRGSRSDVVALALLLAATLYTHTIAAFAALGVLVAWACFPLDRRAIGRLALAAALAGIALAPWLPQLLRQGGRSVESYSWHEGEFEREFPWQVPRSLAALSHGSLAPVRNRVADLLPQAWVATALGALLAAYAVAGRRRLADPAMPLRLIVAIVLPLLAIFVVATLGPPIYVVGRVDVFVLPFLLLLVAAGLTLLSVPARAGAAVAFAGLALLPLQVLFRLDVRSQEKLIAAMLRSERRTAEPVVATTFLPCLEFYAGVRRDEQLFAFPARPASTTSWIDRSAHPSRSWPAEAAAVVRRVQNVAATAGSSRVWVVCGRDDLGRALTGAFDRALPLLGIADLHFQDLEMRAYGVPPGAPPL